jgi:hypothetical protein
LEGGLFIDFGDETVELLPGHMITVKRGIRAPDPSAIVPSI